MYEMQALARPFIRSQGLEKICERFQAVDTVKTLCENVNIWFSFRPTRCPFTISHLVLSLEPSTSHPDQIFILFTFIYFMQSRHSLLLILLLLSCEYMNGVHSKRRSIFLYLPLHEMWMFVSNWFWIWPCDTAVYCILNHRRACFMK